MGGASPEEVRTVEEVRKRQYAEELEEQIRVRDVSLEDCNGARTGEGRGLVVHERE